MPNYARAYVPGGTFFFTLISHRRLPLFTRPADVTRLRNVINQVQNERPFEVVAGVVLPDHLHLLWTLPRGDSDFSSRVGRMKALFTRTLHTAGTRATAASTVSASRQKHREHAVWQRRFWEHAIRDQEDLKRHVDYIHYNPVKHRLATCPHAWDASSFRTWADKGYYPGDWLCTCGDATVRLPDFSMLRVCEFD